MDISLNTNKKIFNLVLISEVSHLRLFHFTLISLDGLVIY